MTQPKEKPESKVEPLLPGEQPVIPDLTPEETDAEETYHLECCCCGARDQCSPEEANEKGWRFDEEAQWPVCPECAGREEMPSVQYPGGDYDHDELECEKGEE